jgi:gamma-glutamyltranspeptidase/glutathione hydrolase
MFTTRPELRGTFGACASTHWLASASGMAVLEAGGNAFDAAVAMGFVLQVVEPHLNGPGGEVPIVFHEARSGANRILCGQGTAPAGATIAHYRDQGLDMVPGSGLLATVIPGAVDAWMQLLRDYGTLPPREVLKYAIGYARDGFPLAPMIPVFVERVAELLRDEWPTSAALWLPDGEIPKAGSLFRNPQLAITYERLVAEGEAAGGDRETQIEALRRAWSQGFVAEAVEHFATHTEAMDSSGERHAGVLTAQDMAGWQAHYEAPLARDFRGYTVLKGGCWSQGPAFLQQLALLDGFALEDMPPDGPDFVHTVVEASKLAFADREAYYGDPDFVEVPLEALLSDAYAAERRTLIGGAASLELRPGRIPGYEAQADALPQSTAGGEAAGLGAGEPTVQTGDDTGGCVKGDTCHLDVIDRWGNMVGATPSGGWLQSSPTIPELGFCLNSRAQMFWLEPGYPASLEPGKRPRTTLSVNLVLREGRPYMVFGTPGGDYQDQWALGVFLRHAVHGLNLQAAIDHPAYQTDHMPSSFWPRTADLGSLTLEARFPQATIDELRRRGHKVTIGDAWSLGRVSAAAREPDGLLKAAANPRFMQGYAIAR